VSPADPGPSLAISAYEQVEFFARLWTDRLPVSKRAMRLAREMTKALLKQHGLWN
jgi:beta-lactamase class D